MRTSLAMGSTLALGLALAGAAWSADRREIEGEGFTFTEVRPGVYHVVGKGATFAGSNGALIVNESDALLVDSHMTPPAARALLRDLPRVTDHPLRWVVNTHFHFDHVSGNQVFGPGVEIVSHERTRQEIVAGGSVSGRGWETFVAPIPGRIESLEAELGEAEGERREEIEGTLARLRAFTAELEEIEPTPPTLTLRRALTLHRGAREIRVLFFGRGHTDGDVVVYLPDERVLVVGDLLADHPLFSGDARLEEWADTLEHLKGLEVDVILTGHGRILEGGEWIGWYQAYLRDLWPKIVEMYRAGVPAAEAAQRIDMTAHGEHLQIAGPGVRLDAVERAYELLDAR